MSVDCIEVAKRLEDFLEKGPFIDIFHFTGLGIPMISNRPTNGTNAGEKLLFFCSNLNMKRIIIIFNPFIHFIHPKKSCDELRGVVVTKITVPFFV